MIYILSVSRLARDAEERQKWISNLEEAISLNSVNTVRCLLRRIYNKYSHWFT